MTEPLQFRTDRGEWAETPGIDDEYESAIRRVLSVHPGRIVEVWDPGPTVTAYRFKPAENWYR